MRPAVLFSLFIIKNLVTSRLKHCSKKIFGNELDEDPKILCVCNATYCDEVPRLGQLRDYEAVVFTSSISGKRFERKVVKFSKRYKDGNVLKVNINATKRFQKILGFGGAFTDAAGINLYRLSEATQQKFLETYFGEKGINYTVCRVPMASCDFSTHEYSYDDQDGDFNMTYFNLTDEDFQYKIPFIQSAQNLSKGKLKIFGSPWSAPAWMKTNGHMKGGGSLKGQVGGDYYKAWSQYFIRFLEEYSKNNIKLWGVTLQNEPMTGLDPGYLWQTMYLSPQMQQVFVKDILGPQIRSHPELKNMKIMVHDDASFLIPGFVDPILNDSSTAKFVNGIAFHWYSDFWSPATNIKEAHKHHPNKFILMTEACNGFQSSEPGPRIGNWTRGELYASDIIRNLQNWVNGWVDWNMCLDEQGGPNWVQNFVDAPIIVNNTEDEFYKQPMFYTMGHFSKFVTPNSIRIQSAIIGNYSASKLDLIAFTTPLRQRVLIISNRDSTNYTLLVEDSKINGKFLKIYVEPRSIKTVIWNKAHKKSA